MSVSNIILYTRQLKCRWARVWLNYRMKIVLQFLSIYIYITSTYITVCNNVNSLFFRYTNNFIFLQNLSVNFRFTHLTCYNFCLYTICICVYSLMCYSSQFHIYTSKSCVFFFFRKHCLLSLTRKNREKITEKVNCLHI